MLYAGQAHGGGGGCCGDDGVIVTIKSSSTVTSRDMMHARTVSHYAIYTSGAMSLLYCCRL